MAMKSVNSALRGATRGLAVCCVVLLSACAGNSTKPESPAVAEAGVLQPDNSQPQLLPTDGYLPQQKKDAQGKWLSYDAIKNPYLANKSQVNKGSVLLFIEAQKAWRDEDYTTVEQKLNVIVNNDKALSGPWVMRARLSLKREQYEKAEEQLLKALALNSENVNAYPLLAQVQRLQGKFFHAQNTLARALSLWPDFPEAHYNLALLYDAYLNKEVAAQQHLEAYLFLEKEVEPAVYAWLKDIASRTGVQQSSVGKQTNPSEFLRQADVLLANE